MWAERNRKLFLRGSRKRLWSSCFLGVLLWQFCPQGSAKATTDNKFWLLNSEGNRDGIFVKGRRQTLLYCYKWGQGKHVILRKIRKTTANKSIIAWNRMLTSKEPWNKNGSKSTITNYKPWPFELFEMNIYCLRGLLSWGDKSRWLSKNHGSLAGGISISRGLRCSWRPCHQISLDYYTIPPVTQATNQQKNLCHTFSDDVLLFAFLRFSGVEVWDSHRQHTDAWQ